MKWVHMVAYLLVFVGALNWGLVGLLKLNVVESVFGMGTLTNLVYDLVGLAGLYTIYSHLVLKDCKTCSK